MDEVGRGPLAGPVTVCAYAVRAEEVPGVKASLRAAGCGDSKALSAPVRERVAAAARRAAARGAARLAVRSVSAAEIDRGGIARAIRRALARALGALGIDPSEADVRLDGSLAAPARFKTQRTIVRGDASDLWIGAASCVAKVYRDAAMARLAARYPGYGFEGHAGYGTLHHRRAIHRLGLSPVHRKSFCRGIVRS